VAEHDNGYKRLFSHPEMVEDLIRGFVREDWVKDLDFTTLERVSGHYVTRQLRSRKSDVVWRKRWLYVYLLIEFQSTVDPWMAFRVMTYLGLFYQDLIWRRELTEGKLPPVLPLVLYNGRAPWSAARDIAELIENVPGGLEQYRRNCGTASWTRSGLPTQSWIVKEPGGGAVPAGEKPRPARHRASIGGSGRVAVGGRSQGAQRVVHTLAP
jgi:hypothetical protein